MMAVPLDIRQVSPQRIGPAVPTIAFWSGTQLLGEVRGHPSDLEDARARVKRFIEAQGAGLVGRGRLARLATARVVLYCGQRSQAL